MAFELSPTGHEEDNDAEDLKRDTELRNTSAKVPGREEACEHEPQGPQERKKGAGRYGAHWGHTSIEC